MSETIQSGPSIGILDYGMGNLRSVHRAFLAVGAKATIVQTPDQMEGLDALVFPGQGAIVDTMRLLQQCGWCGFIRDWIDADRPFFGICLGLQALFEHSEEGSTPGLGILPGCVRRFRYPANSGIKIPHMGWNSVRFLRPADPLLADINPDGDQFYFVHSYYVIPQDESTAWGVTEYGGMEFCSAVSRGNLLATQFHPEKSQQKGLQLYRNFIEVVKSSLPSQRV